MIEGETRTYSTPVDPAFGFKRVEVRLSIPAVPDIAKFANFAEHAYDIENRRSTDLVVGIQRGGLLVSNDLGRSWEFVATPETKSLLMWNVFTTSGQTHFLQSLGPQQSAGSTDKVADNATSLLCYDSSWRFVSQPLSTKFGWHGSRSIDECGGTIMFAEYPDNLAKYSVAFRADPDGHAHLCDDSRVFRSRDGGQTWTVVFEQSWKQVRHFHTLAADLWSPGTWWLSSGDLQTECRIWQSRDDGNTWIEVQGHVDDFPDDDRTPRKQTVFRHTDLQITEDLLIWGCDDILSPGDYSVFVKAQPGQPQSGARVFVASKTPPIIPSAVGFVGNPIRSIVDVGLAFLLISEAKSLTHWSRPQVFLLGKEKPYLTTELFTLDNFSTRATGLTFSRASRAAKNGRFFSFRQPYDVFNGGIRLLQWDVQFF